MDAVAFDRRLVVAAASDARGKGDRKRAIALYRDVIAHAPDDDEVHGKLAQLLAENGDVDDAATHFRAGADGFHKRGFTDRAIALLKQAVEHAPRDVDAWLRMSELNLVRLRKAEADKLLAAARKHFTRAKDRANAARILDARLALDKQNVDVAIDRAQVAKKLGQRGFGILFLTELCALVDDKARRRLRRALFGLRPTPASLWRWLRNAPATP